MDSVSKLYAQRAGRALRRKASSTSEFDHYPGCKHNDPDNCSGCALTDTKQAAPNYAAWPLAYMENRRIIPAKWRKAFRAEMNQRRNIPYANNIKATVQRLGVRFSDMNKITSNISEI